MFNFTMTFNKSEKLYIQLYNYIAAEIRSGRIAEGERMPSKKALASHLRLSVNTVETAYSILVQEGFLKSVPRSGYYARRLQSKTQISPRFNIPEKHTPEFDYDFSISAQDPDAFPSQTWIKLSKEVMYENPSLLRAGEFSGDIELRCAIAKYLYEFRGVSCEPNQIVVGAGMEYLLMLLTRILPEGSIYAVENPGYRKTHDIFANTGGRIEYIGLDNEGMITEELSYSGANIAYITPSHQFPTGIIMSADRRYKLLEWAYSAKNRYIIEDDYNNEFNYSIKPVPAMQGMDLHERVIYMSTFSRTLAPSIRIAYMVLPSSLAEPFFTLYGRFSPTVPRFEQHTLERFITGGWLERHLNRTRLLYRKRRDALIELLNSSNIDFEISGEKSGIQLLAKTNAAAEIRKRAFENRIKLSYISDFYFTDKQDNALIIGYARADEAALKRFNEILIK
ncbi:MAG: PLP-dependent aminotransferase family protein [bacterium]|nr:PLP-dependent aminotransferase family protein [bacterium]